MSLINFSLDHRMVAPERGNFHVWRSSKTTWDAGAEFREAFYQRHLRTTVVVFQLNPWMAIEFYEVNRGRFRLSRRLKLAYVIKYPRYYKTE